MTINHLSKTDAVLAGADLTGKHGYFGDFMEYAGITPRGNFIYDIVNEGIESITPEAQRTLLHWAQKTKWKEAQRKEAPPPLSGSGPASTSRRALVKKLGVIGTGVVLVGGEALEGYKITAGLTGTGIAVGGTAALQAAKIAAQCEEWFREKLPVWLKEQHGIDFTFPERQKAMQSLR